MKMWQHPVTGKNRGLLLSPYQPRQNGSAVKGMRINYDWREIEGKHYLTALRDGVPEAFMEVLPPLTPEGVAVALDGTTRILTS